jgi:hypothetical protein
MNNSYKPLALLGLILVAVFVATLFAPHTVETSQAQAGPPRPSPSLDAALQRGRAHIRKMCRNQNKITDRGALVSKCIHEGNVPLVDVHWEPAGTADNQTQQSRWKIRGWMMWQYFLPTTGPCFKNVAKQIGFQPGTIITAWRTMYVFWTKDQTVGMRLLPWRPCYPNLA